MADASYVVDLLLGRPAAMELLDAATRDDRHQPLHVPELIEPEALNVLRRLELRADITSERATDAVADFAAMRLVRYPHEPLRGRVWALRHALTAYDATYLALAEALDHALFVTGDGGLAERAGAALGSDRVRLVA